MRNEFIIGHRVVMLVGEFPVFTAEEITDENGRKVKRWRILNDHAEDEGRLEDKEDWIQRQLKEQ